MLAEQYLGKEVSIIIDRPRIILFSKYSFHFRCHLSPVAFSIILFLLVPDTTFAQQNFQWRNFTRIGDDLSSNNVRTITEDRFGQIWLGTDKGLSRLSGFWHEAGGSSGGPQGANVFKVFEDSAGFIWVATAEGVYQGAWDPLREEVDWLQHYNQQTGLIGIGGRVVTMIQRQNGEIWIGTPLGVNRFDGTAWRAVDGGEVGQLNQGVQVIYEDKVGDLWFGLSQSHRLQSGNLISRFSNLGWEIFGVNDGLPNGDVQTILEDHLGNLWIGTTAGAVVYDGSTWHVVTTQNEFLIGNNVQSIMSDREGTIWIGTTAGISQFRLPAQFSPAALRDLERWRHLTRANGLASNNIQALFETRTGEIWIGTRDNGANFSDRSWESVTTDNGLSHNSVTAMLKDQRGRLWVGTGNGLSLYTGNGIELVSGAPGNEIRALAEDFQGRIWVGTNAGIGVYDGVTWEVFRIPDINVNSVQSIVVDSVGDVWAGTGFLPTDELPGLDRYDGQQWERNLFLEIGRTIVVMFVDSQGRIYFATVGNEEGGSDLWVYEGVNPRQIYDASEQFSIHTILEVTDREIWVGTDAGIQIFDQQTLNPTVSLTTTDGLADNRVQVLYRDEDRVWIGTADGVSLFRNGQFERTLTASDGLNSNNISTIAKVNEVLWFGSRDSGGLSIFSPEMTPPRTRITDGPKDSEIVGETSVVFKFEGGDASTPAGELRYFYQLNDGPLTPTDDEGIAKRALLSSLTEGPHRFTVYAMDREGNQDLTGASAEFVVDSLAPFVSITAPEANAVIGGVYEIRGTAMDETDFLDYQIRIFPGPSVSGESLPPFVSTVPVRGDTLYRWDTRTVAAGLYTIELMARDTPSGDYDREPHLATTSVTVEVDRLRPQVEILSPAENEQVRQRIEIRGTADDRNFKEYIIEYGPGESPDTWLPISTPPAFSNPVTRDVLALWDAPNLSGQYTLRLIVEDTAGHREFDQVHIFFNQSVNRETGGLVKSHDNRATITFPPNSLPRTTIVTVNPVSEESTPTVSTIPVQVYNFAPEDLQLHRLKPAAIQFSIEDTATLLSRSQSEETLTIARWDGKTWLPIGGTIDASRRTVSTVVSRLGRYGITTRPTVETEENTIISDLTCQPRVFSPSRESTWISFRLNRPDDVTIKIYNEAGRLRRLLRESEPLSVGGHVFEWDGRDDKNQRVVSNFYFVTVEGEGALGTKVVVVQND